MFFKVLLLQFDIIFYENIAKIQFMDCAKIAIKKSLFTMEDHYLVWLEEQFENKLPKNINPQCQRSL